MGTNSQLLQIKFILLLSATVGCKQVTSKSSTASNNESVEKETSNLSLDELANKARMTFENGSFAAPVRHPDVTTAPWSQLKSKTQLMAADVTPSTPTDSVLALNAVTTWVSIGHTLTPVRDQAMEGKCTAFALAAAMESLIKATFGSSVVLSTEHLWSKYGEYNVESSIKISRTSLLATESDWPYGSQKPKDIDRKGKYLTLEARRISLDVIHDAIAAGHPVVFTFIMTNAVKNVGVDGWIVPSSDKKKPFGDFETFGHAVMIWGSYKYPEPVRGSKGYWAIKNSWGKAFGKIGHMWMPYEYCEHAKDSCEAYEIVNVAKGEMDDGKRNPARVFSEQSSSSNSNLPAVKDSDIEKLGGVCVQYENGPPQIFTKGVKFCQTLGPDKNSLKTTPGGCNSDWCLQNGSAL